MTLTKGQAVTIRQALGFCDSTLSPSKEEIAAFIGMEERGEPSPFPYFSLSHCVLSQLHLGHRLASGMQRNIWIDGLADYPLGQVVQDFIIDTKSKSHWMRRLPAYEMAYNLHSRMMGHDSKWAMQQEPVVRSRVRCNMPDDVREAR